MTAADIEALDRLVKRVGPRIAGIAGHIDLESHAGVTETAKASVDLCRGIGSPAPGINHDAGNVRFYSGIDPVADLAAVYRQIGFQARSAWRSNSRARRALTPARVRRHPTINYRN